jgi:signal transduction histidine kinase
MKTSHRPRFSFTVMPSVVFGIALSVGVGALCYYVTHRLIENENLQRFQTMARTAQFTINARIKSYTNVLRATASLYNAEPNVTREKFHRFYQSLDLPTHYPAIAALNYVQWVADADRDALESRIREEEIKSHYPGPRFTIFPPGRRPTYSPVVVVEPREKWPHTIGYDLNAIPIHLKSLEDARDSGRISASGTPVYPMRDKRNLGLALRLPVYRVGAPIATVEQRRQAYVGSLGIAFSVKLLVDGVLDEIPLKTVRLSLFNYVQTLNVGEKKPRQLIYDSTATYVDPTPRQEVEDDSLFHVWLPIDYNGREWSAHFSVPKQSLNRATDNSFPLLALLAGTTTMMLLYGLFYTLTSSRARAVELANGMTRELRESQQQLLLSHQKLRQLAAHTEHIKEIERKRIAREIHDDLGQNLLALRIEAQMLSSRTSERHPRLHARAETTLGQIDSTIKSVRQIINDLRPTVLDLGLNAAVDWQIAQFDRRTGIRCDLVEYHRDIVVDDHCATALFRILQESLTNVRRHAAATWVRVDLRVEHGSVRMSIRDNGVGLHLSGHKPGTFGLLGMEERVAMLGGTFSLNGAPGGGTTVEVAIPVRQEIAAVTAQLPAQAEPQENVSL